MVVSIGSYDVLRLCKQSFSSDSNDLSLIHSFHEILRADVLSHDALLYNRSSLGHSLCACCVKFLSDLHL